MFYEVGDIMRWPGFDSQSFESIEVRYVLRFICVLFASQQHPNGPSFDPFALFCIATAFM